MQGNREFPNYKYHENCHTFLLMEMSCELQVAFHALRFAAPIQELGNRFAIRTRIEGPYIALHSSAL
jgi:hypothetical protein